MRAAPRTNKGRETRRRILAAAETVFSSSGYSDASVARITDVAGVGQGTFYLYFDTKLELFEQLVEDLNRRVRRAMSEASTAAPDRIQAERAGFRAFFEFTADHPSLYRIVREAELVSPGALRLHYSRIVDGYIEGLRQAGDAGEIGDIDPTVAAWALMGIGEMIGMRRNDRHAVGAVVQGRRRGGPRPAGQRHDRRPRRSVRADDDLHRARAGPPRDHLRPQRSHPTVPHARRTAMTDLSGRRAVVTGGASGIGAACARALATAGAHVSILDLDGDGASDVAREIGGESRQIDLGDTAALADIELDCDILVNNAGIQTVAPIQDFDPQRFSLILRIMLEAPFLLVRASLPSMYERGFGRIINISSVHGLRASPFKSAYVAAKHGLEGLSKVIALEGGPQGVTSNCLNPAYVNTPLVQKQIADQARIHSIAEDDVVSSIMLTESAIKRLVEPHEVASLAVWLAGEDAGMVTGASYTLDGGWSAR